MFLAFHECITNLYDLGENCNLRTFLGESGELVSKAESLLVDLVTALKDGWVRVSQLEFLKEHSARFYDLCKLRDAQQSSHKIFSDAQTHLSDRIKQLVSYEKERQLLENFVSHCRLVSSSEDLSQLTHIIRTDVSDIEMRNLAQQDTSPSAVMSCSSVLSSYRQYVDLIWKGRNSCIFEMLWNEKRSEVARLRTDSQPPLTLAEVVEMVCKPIADLWQSICEEVVSGSLPLERVSVLFRSPETEMVNLDQELSCMGDFCGRQENAKWKQQRRKQIEQYSKLKDTIEAAHSLKQVMAALQMLRGFPEIDYICMQVSFFLLIGNNVYRCICVSVHLQDSPDFRKQPIRMLTDDLISAGEFLASLTHQKIACLKSFTEAPNLILWLRRDIKSKPFHCDL